MDEYVKKSSVIDWFRPYGHMDEPIPFETLVSDLRGSIPAADVEPVVHTVPVLRYRPQRYERYEESGLNDNGEVLYVKRVFVDEKSYAMYCPSCGKRLCSRFTNFCPNCGAKMEGGAG